MFLLLLALAGTAAATSTDAEKSAMYIAAKQQYNMDYPQNSEDESNHFAVFCEAVDQIEDHNEHDGDQWHAAVNEYALMTEAEKAQHLGLNISSVIEAQRRSLVKRSSPRLAKRQDSSVDWSGKLPGIKNQGSCGSCWTFGANAALEYQINKDRTGTMKSLSEEQLLDCTYTDDDGCNGGWPTACYDWVESNGGIASTVDYPYVGSDGTCVTNVDNAIDGFSVTGYSYLSDGDSAMEAAVADSDIGVISVAIGVVDSFYYYDSGIYSETGCSSINHAVDVVGYGEIDGVGYWKVRNSWGTWGDNGYIKMERGLNGANINTCAISSYGHYPLVSGSDSDGNDGDGSDDSDDGSDDNSDDDSSDDDNCVPSYQATEIIVSPLYISSPDYPAEYPNSHDACTSVIYADDGLRVRLEFTAFELESHSTCGYDYLEIRDGDSSSAELIGKYCGSTSPGTIESSGNAMWVDFHSDSSVTEAGFQATIRAFSGDGETDDVTDEPSEAASEEASEAASEDSSEDVCEPEYAATAEQQEITSPEYPNEYPNGHDDCVTVLWAEEGQNVELVFTDFELESHSTCNYDWVQVRDGDSSESELLGTWCGSDSPGTIRSSGSMLYVEFHSDGSVVRTGYQAWFSAVEDVVMCARPAIENGDVSPYNDTILAGDVYTASCAAGFELSGPATIFCDENGTLSDVPMCEEIQLCWNSESKTKITDGTKIATLYDVEQAQDVCLFMDECDAVCCFRDPSDDKGCKLYSGEVSSGTSNKYTSYSYGPCEDQ